MRVNLPVSRAQRFLLLAFLASTLAWSGAAGAAPEKAEPAAIASLLNALNAAGVLESPVLHVNDQGYVRFLSAPQGGSFSAPATVAKSGDTEAIARAFLEEHAAAFGVTSDAVSFRLVNLLSYGGFTYVRFQQQYSGMDVVGAQVVVQLNDADAITNVITDLLTDTHLLDDGTLSLAPGLSQEEALQKARLALSQSTSAYLPADFKLSGTPELNLYVPELVGKEGGLKLVWQFQLDANNKAEQVSQAVFLDAQTGNVSFRYSLLRNALDRTIVDAALSFYTPGWEIVREEGDPPAYIEEADLLYDLYGGIYNYWMDTFGRDSWDGQGSQIIGYVRINFLNAGEFDSDDTMFGLYGTGMVADDIVAHEFTHGVTGSVVDLIYFAESGALSEMYSDVFGEFTDWHIDWGNDSEEVRWWIAEDVDIDVLSYMRYMKDPTRVGDPDRYNSPYWEDSPFVDNQGVHINNGVGNKLCYLLTDGDYFNGYTIKAIGEDRVAELYYVAMHLLLSSSDYYDFARALGSAAVSLNWSFSDRLNLANAVRAVEIEPPSGGALDSLGGLCEFRATPTRNALDQPVVALTWDNPSSITYDEVRLQRSVSGFTLQPDDASLLVNGTMQEYLDTDVQAGVEYFYTLIGVMKSGLPQLAFARVVADDPVAPVLSQAFGTDPTTGPQGAFDLAYSQLMFTPVGEPRGDYGSASALGDLSDYEVTLTRNVTEFPVEPDNTDGSTKYYALVDNYGVDFTFGKTWTFPFFGSTYSNMYIASNGYITFLRVPEESTLNIPSLEAHYAIPRISFLFSKLSPQQGGEIWARLMDDRVAITFQSVPEMLEGGSYSAKNNSVQVELFYSGHIRMTFLEVNLSSAIVGLSDGRGLPVNPSDVFDDVAAVPVTTDLSQLSSATTQLSIAPISPQWGYEGDSISFAVETSPAGSAPVLTASWDGPGNVPFADNLDGTGSFFWETTTADEGNYTVRITAKLDGATVYQDVRLLVYNQRILPEVINVGLATDASDDDPYQSRLVDYGRTLSVTYTYYHPEQYTSPGTYGEGASLIYWYRNYQVVAGFTSVLSIPKDQIAPGDVWFYEVYPVSLIGTIGEPVRSPVVTVNGDPVVEAVVPAYGLVSGGDVVRIHGTFLSGPMHVTFGGVSAPVVRSISDKIIEVTTPVYAGSVTEGNSEDDLVDIVDISVVTAVGTGYLPEAFTYKAVRNETIDEVKTDALLGCGASTGKTQGDAFVVLLAAGLIWAAVRRSRVGLQR